MKYLPLILTILSLSHPLMAQTINNREKPGNMIVQNSDRTTAENLLNEGLALFEEETQSTTLEAIKKLEKALIIWQKLGDKKQEIITLNNLGLMYDDLGETQKSLDYYERSLPLIKKLGDEKQEGIILSNIAAMYGDLGENQKALEYLQKSLNLSQKVTDKKQQGITISRIGFIYYSLGEKEKALNYYQQSLPLSKEAQDQSQESITLSNIGLVYSELGEQKQALNYYQQSLILTQKLEDKSQGATTLNNIGLAYSELGDTKKALEYYEKSLLFSRELGDKSQESITLDNIGLAYIKLGDKQKALIYLQQSLVLIQKVGDQAQIAYTFGNIAYAYYEQKDLNKALEYMKKSIDVAENLRSKIINKELKTSFFANVHDYYEFYIEILMDLHEKEPRKGYDVQAFNISEQSKARVLLELLKEANIDIKKGISPQLLQQKKALQEQIEQVEKEKIKLSKKDTNDPKIAILGKQQEKLLNEYAELQTKIRINSPDYAAITKPKPVTLAEIQQKVLDKDTVLLEYSLGKENSYVWLVSQDKISSYELPGTKEIDEKVKELRQEITSNDTTIKKVQTKSLLLSKMILAPVINQIGNKRLLIVADGSLQYIPFNVLQNPNETTKYSPLILTNEIITLPSASTVISLRENQKSKGKNSKQIAVIADPIFAQDDERVKPLKTPNKQVNNDLGQLALNRAAGSTSLQLDRLKATRKEAEEIKKLIPEKEQIQVLDFEANLNFVKTNNLADYKIIHFATHGIANSNNPELSGLVLSLFDNQGNAQNGFLRLNDIFNLKLNADLVVLSACQTGLGKQVKGEGLVGLTRGFMYAGTPRVVVSLWSVDDQGTSVLMSRFYELMLKKKMPVSSALRQAQIEIMQQENYKLPYFWAAFTIQGEWK